MQNLQTGTITNPKLNGIILLVCTQPLLLVQITFLSLDFLIFKDKSYSKFPYNQLKTFKKILLFDTDVDFSIIALKKDFHSFQVFILA